MKRCDLTLDTPAENLACDEVLLLHGGAACLRFWEPTNYFVVLGYANRAAREVHLPFCQAHGIPVLRRCTGGGTVLQGPGCLNYSLILPIDPSGPLQSITATNRFILERHRAALAPLLEKPVALAGATDLTLANLKFSGNAQRRGKDFLIFHGTLLLHFDISMIEQALPLPSQQPEYRAQRAHADFLTNLPLEAALVKETLAQAWQATAGEVDFPLNQVRKLAREKYQLDEWNFKC